MMFFLQLSRDFPCDFVPLLSEWVTRWNHALCPVLVFSLWNLSAVEIMHSVLFSSFRCEIYLSAVEIIHSDRSHNEQTNRTVCCWSHTLCPVLVFSLWDLSLCCWNHTLCPVLVFSLWDMSATETIHCPVLVFRCGICVLLKSYTLSCYRLFVVRFPCCWNHTLSIVSLWDLPAVEITHSTCPVLVFSLWDLSAVEIIHSVPFSSVRCEICLSAVEIMHPVLFSSFHCEICLLLKSYTLSCFPCEICLLLKSCTLCTVLVFRCGICVLLKSHSVHRFAVRSVCCWNRTLCPVLDRCEICLLMKPCTLSCSRLFVVRSPYCWNRTLCPVLDRLFVVRFVCCWNRTLCPVLDRLFVVRSVCCWNRTLCPVLDRLFVVRFVCCWDHAIVCLHVTGSHKQGFVLLHWSRCEKGLQATKLKVKNLCILHFFCFYCPTSNYQNLCVNQLTSQADIN